MLVFRPLESLDGDCVINVVDTNDDRIVWYNQIVDKLYMSKVFVVVRADSSSLIELLAATDDDFPCQKRIGVANQRAKVEIMNFVGNQYGKIVPLGVKIGSY